VEVGADLDDGGWMDVHTQELIWGGRMARLQGVAPTRMLSDGSAACR
jgi:hypothetical protein